MCFKRVLALICFSAIISLGSALQCYSCAAIVKSECAQGAPSSMVIQDCNNKTNEGDQSNQDSASFKEVCLRFYEIEFTPSICVRGCGIIPANAADPCEYVGKFLHVAGCKSCTTDLCNLDDEEAV